MFDPKKPLQTRNGYPVRILCDDFKGRFPILAAYTFAGREYLRYYTLDGKGNGTMNDLVNVKEVRWVNLYYNKRTGEAEVGPGLWSIEEDARSCAAEVPTPLIYQGTHKVEW